MSYWTLYWTNKTVRTEANRVHEREEFAFELEHAGGAGFRKRGVKPGDTVYVVTNVYGVIHLIGKIVVDEIIDKDEVGRRLENDDLWIVTDHIVAKKPYAPCRFDVVVPPSQTKDVEFITDKGTTGLKFNKRGGVDQQTLRTVRQLTESTARLFDELLS